MGRRKRKGEEISGLLLLDKPLNLSSNHALQRVKRFFGAAKAGHTGSLDPLATGVLPICFGEATKFSQCLLDADKAYVVEGKLGVRTSTGDVEGEVIAAKVLPSSLDEPQFKQTLLSFTGIQQQVPSMYSALKHQGKPLYTYARKGIEIERPPREICLYEIKLTAFDLPYFSLSVRCSKGTYIRSLVEDIGEALNCGAHVTRLDRTQCGPFTKEASYTLDALGALTDDKAALLNCLCPVSNLTNHWPRLEVTSEAAMRLHQGQSIKIEAEADGVVQLFCQGQFLGLGEINLPGALCPKRLIRSDKFAVIA